MNRNIIFYVVGTAIFLAIYMYSMGGALFLMLGFGVGLFLHNWLNKMFDDWKSSFYSTETQARINRQKELEVELERLKKGD